MVLLLQADFLRNGEVVFTGDVTAGFVVSYFLTPGKHVQVGLRKLFQYARLTFTGICACFQINLAKMQTLLYT